MKKRRPLSEQNPFVRAIPLDPGTDADMPEMTSTKDRNASTTQSQLDTTNTPDHVKTQNALNTSVSEDSVELAAVPLPANERRVTFSFSLSPAALEAMRDVAYWERDTISGIVEQAFWDFLERKVLERGEPYPARKGRIRTGRPPIR